VLAGAFAGGFAGVDCAAPGVSFASVVAAGAFEPSVAFPVVGLEVSEGVGAPAAGAEVVGGVAAGGAV